MLVGISVVAGAFVNISRAGCQLIFIILVSAHRDKDDNVIFIKFGKMAHVNVTVSLVVDVAVTL
jgi:hypothetical protein